jgi:hypothetical protein
VLLKASKNEPEGMPSGFFSRKKFTNARPIKTFPARKEEILLK